MFIVGSRVFFTYEKSGLAFVTRLRAVNAKPLLKRTTIDSAQNQPAPTIRNGQGIDTRMSSKPIP